MSAQQTSSMIFSSSTLFTLVKVYPALVNLTQEVNCFATEDRVHFWAHSAGGLVGASIVCVSTVAVTSPISFVIRDSDRFYEIIKKYGKKKSALQLDFDGSLTLILPNREILVVFDEDASSSIIPPIPNPTEKRIVHALDTSLSSAIIDLSLISGVMTVFSTTETEPRHVCFQSKSEFGRCMFKIAPIDAESLPVIEKTCFLINSSKFINLMFSQAVGNTDIFISEDHRRLYFRAAGQTGIHFEYILNALVDE